MRISVFLLILFITRIFLNWNCYSALGHYEAPFSYLFSSSWYQEPDFLISRNTFPDGRRSQILSISDIKNSFLCVRDFMSDLHQSKRHDLIHVDMFNDTSRYLDDILFTIDNPEFEKYISDTTYAAELQLNNVNTSDKETSFLDLNIKVIDSDIHTSVYDKRDDFGFPIVPE